MRIRGKLVHAAGMILFFAGIFIGILTAGGLTWASLEAHFYFGYGIQGDRRLKVSCPLVMAASETGTAAVSISNPADRQIHLRIDANITGPYVPTTLQTNFIIDPGQRQITGWEIGPANIAFGHLILVQIYQYSSYPLSSAEGYCGTLVLALHGLTGKQFLALFLAVGLFGILGGFGLNFLGKRLLEEQKTEETSGMLFLCGFVLMGVLAGALGWWLLGVIAIALSLLLTIILFNRRIIAA